MPLIMETEYQIVKYRKIHCGSNFLWSSVKHIYHEHTAQVFLRSYHAAFFPLRDELRAFKVFLYRLSKFPRSTLLKMIREQYIFLFCIGDSVLVLLFWG